MSAYAIANYTALPAVKAALDAAESAGGEPAAAEAASCEGGLASAGSPAEGLREGSTPAPLEGQGDAGEADGARPVVIAHMFPDLLNLYGDGGNVRILRERLARRGIPVRVKRVEYGESIDLGDVDLVFLGGGPDREQKLASGELLRMKEGLRSFVEEGGALLAICGGYQILGKTWLLGDEEVPGLGIVDIETKRPGTSADRLIDNIALSSPLAAHPVVGYENHAGRTYLGSGLSPFGKVVSSTGHGNNDGDGADGVLYKKLVGTYLHGPLLSKNPEVADWLLRAACDRWSVRTGCDAPELGSLDDAPELAANDEMARRLGAR